jgi:hypothetical protein
MLLQVKKIAGLGVFCNYIEMHREDTEIHREKTHNFTIARLHYVITAPLNNEIASALCASQ